MEAQGQVQSLGGSWHFNWATRFPSLPVCWVFCASGLSPFTETQFLWVSGFPYLGNHLNSSTTLSVVLTRNVHQVWFQHKRTDISVEATDRSRCRGLRKVRKAHRRAICHHLDQPKLHFSKGELSSGNIIPSSKFLSFCDRWDLITRMKMEHEIPVSQRRGPSHMLQMKGG